MRIPSCESCALQLLITICLRRLHTQPQLCQCSFETFPSVRIPSKPKLSKTVQSCRTSQSPPCYYEYWFCFSNIGGNSKKVKILGVKELASMENDVKWDIFIMKTSCNKKWDQVQMEVGELLQTEYPLADTGWI